MNSCQLKGVGTFLLGAAEQRLGRIVGNNTLQASGFHKQIEGRALIAIGDARQAIKQRVKRTAL